MKRNLVLPSYIAQLGALTLSVHELRGSLSGEARAVLLTELVRDELVIRSMAIKPSKEIPLERHSDSFPRLIKSQAAWLKELLEAGSDQISPHLIYENFSRATARNLLSGHILAWRFIALLPQKPQSPSGNKQTSSEKKYPKFDMSRTGTTLTAFTTRNYVLLTRFLETSPLQLLAALEGVSTVTIRNRIQGARESNKLSRPGSGRRGSNPNNHHL